MVARRLLAPNRPESYVEPGHDSVALDLAFAGRVEVKEGRARVRVRLDRADVEYQVHAFVTTGLDWVAVEGFVRT